MRWREVGFGVGDLPVKEQASIANNNIVSAMKAKNDLFFMACFLSRM
jgi:hypothetical protein